MTIKEFYNWAVENGIEDYKMQNDDYPMFDYEPEDWHIDEEQKIVCTWWEC